MQLRPKKTSPASALIERVTDEATWRELADQATDVTTRVAGDMARRSADLGSQVGERMGDAARVLSQEGQEFMEHHAKKSRHAPKAAKPRRHRLRKGLTLLGLGAVAAYFLDPKAGAERRAMAKRHTSTSAQVVGDGLDRAAEVAHQTAEVTRTDNDHLPK